MKIVPVIMLCLYLPGRAHSQVDTLSGRQLIFRENIRAQTSLTHPDLVLDFYDLLQYRTAWIRDTSRIRQWLTLTGNAAQYGLNAAIYKRRWPDVNKTPSSSVDSIVWDLTITDLCISFLIDLLHGAPPSSIGYTGLSVKQDHSGIPSLLFNSLRAGNMAQWLDSIDNKSQVYLWLKKELELMAHQPDSFNLKQQQALFSAVSTMRWLQGLQHTGKLIVVNIPSATLAVYDHDTVPITSNVIVGKLATPTPTLTSEVTQVVLYPYWMVPNKIARRELLPLIKKHISYLEQNNFQVLDHYGRIIDPNSINWQALSADYFPYTLRQSTGCDNSLGLIKLEFYSPYSVYLHDTPAKMLFLLPQRFFSHGCIRVEKAKELARLLLNGNTKIFDGLITDDPPAEHDPVYIKLPAPIPVMVLYNTAWPDNSGVVRYYKDVYRKMK